MDEPVARAEYWAKHPGGYDTVHGSVRFPASNPWGIPDVSCASLPALTSLRQYKSGDRLAPQPGEGCHGFADDYRLEPLWTRPSIYVHRLGQFACVLTPDFSVRHGWPLAITIYNTYRNRWLGAYWQSQGLAVVPTVSWAGGDTWDVCFSGVVHGSVVAISTVGCSASDELAVFLRLGTLELVRRARPAALLVYGNPGLLPELPHQLEVRVFPHQPGPGGKAARGLAWLTFHEDGRGRWTIRDEEKGTVLRANLTPMGLLRTLTTWYPTQNATRMIEQGGTRGPDQA